MEETTLTSLESLAVSSILEELQGHLEAFKHILSVRDENSINETFFNDKHLDRKSSALEKVPLEELEYLKELEELRELNLGRLKKENTDDDQDEENETKRKAESLKIQRDLDFLLEIISSTKSEIQSSLSDSSSSSSSKNVFAYLQSTLTEEADRINKESILTTSLCLKQAKVKELQKEIAQIQIETSTKDREQMCHLNSLKDQLELLKQQGKFDKRFTKVWLTARNDYAKDVKQKDEITERRLRKKSIEEQISRDCIAYENVTSWTKLISAELQHKIEQWKQKFATDILDIETRIEKNKKVIQDQHQRILCLRDTISERLVELAPWEEEKEEERRARGQLMRRYHSCRKIQRWWRNYMISHGLYKKKKPKPKTKPKKLK